MGAASSSHGLVTLSSSGRKLVSELEFLWPLGNVGDGMAFVDPAFLKLFPMEKSWGLTRGFDVGDGAWDNGIWVCLVTGGICP